MPRGRYMWASVQTVRGCPKHCSFCSVWRTDGQSPRNRTATSVIGEIVELRRRGFRFIALADDNFYPVSREDLAQAARLKDPTRLQQLQALRAERMTLMAQLARLPDDTVFFTQITMEAAEDPEFLDAMHAAHIRGALVGVESVTAAGLKSIYKNFNLAGDALADRLHLFRDRGVHVLGSFIFGLPTDDAATFDATAAVAQRAGLTFAQFVMLTPFPGTLDFDKWEKSFGDDVPTVDGVPITRHWLIPASRRPKFFMPHPTMGPEEIREPHAGRVGSVLRHPRRSGSAAAASRRSKRASRSCSCRSSTGRCTRTPASLPTAPGARRPCAGRSGSAGRVTGCSPADRCRICRSRPSTRCLQRSV